MSNDEGLNATSWREHCEEFADWSVTLREEHWREDHDFLETGPSPVGRHWDDHVLIERTKEKMKWKGLHPFKFF